MHKSVFNGRIHLYNKIIQGITETTHSKKRIYRLIEGGLIFLEVNTMKEQLNKTIEQMDRLMELYPETEEIHQNLLKVKIGLLKLLIYLQKMEVGL